MAWVLNDREFEAVINAAAATRYEYFIKRVADRREIWSLRTESGWLLLGDPAGRECVPVWPHKRFAEAFGLSPDGSDGEPHAIDSDVFLARWIPGMEKDGRLVAVFPTPANRGVVVAPARLKGDLGSELARVE